MNAQDAQKAQNVLAFLPGTEICEIRFDGCFISTVTQEIQGVSVKYRTASIDRQFFSLCDVVDYMQEHRDAEFNFPEESAPEKSPLTFFFYIHIERIDFTESGNMTALSPEAALATLREQFGLWAVTSVRWESENIFYSAMAVATK